ncbi:MAG: tRNA (adenosine(37)-N6)-dimethylallyltransferase MiaA [Coriobacteriales bacterium]|nr:tRNA (adenosine(37)-N6)-dimethylallyltransferase MiaA [Coriobacteriales bacterium]
MPDTTQVVAIVGPTASGKSSLSNDLAALLESCVVSTDAMQVYKGMDIGTAKEPLEARKVPLLCVDLVDPTVAYSVALFAQEARSHIDSYISRQKIPVVCGGTGLYVRAALEEMDFPKGEQQSDQRIRLEELAQKLGPEAFHKLLQEQDPASAELIHPNNVRRVVRAFELLEQGSSYALEHETLHACKDRHITKRIGLMVNRDILYERINKRVDTMIEQGLVQEVESLYEQNLLTSQTASQAIGYKEIIDVLEGRETLENAIELIKRSTRRYAKRQMTWFKLDQRIIWLDANNLDIESTAVSLYHSLPVVHNS